MHPNPRKILPIVLVVVVLAAAGYWYFSTRSANAQTQVLTGSGTIEAVEIGLGSETGGKVSEVLVSEGETVSAGQEVVHFDRALLDAQLAQAHTALQQAESNYALVAAGTPAAQREAMAAAAQMEILQAQQAIDDLNRLADVAAAQAQQAVAKADKARDDAQELVDNMLGSADPTDVEAARATVVLSRKALEDAQDDFAPYQNKAEDNLARAQFQARLAAAQKNYDNAVTRLNNITGSANQYDLAVAQANLALAESNLAEAQRQYDKVRSGPDPDKLALAESRLETAKAQLDAAQAEPTSEQLALAESQVEQAQSAVNLAQTQLEKTTVTAPTAGIILSRLVEPGEVVAPGGTLLTIVKLDDLSITVYLPEDQYGVVSLGQSAQVTADSFPGQVFEGKVTHIADQAEFTPRNVQTAEGRRTTVFAVKLSVANPEGALKPGMPADVTFNE